jgi:oxaloacetate decarboxylase alpha subunit
MTTTRRQLEELDLGHLFPQVIAETERVRAELGYPIMVTPFPQMVLTQATTNIVGGERYRQVSDQILRYALGKLGRPTSPIAPEILDVIMDRPRAREIAEEPDFPDYAELRKRFGETMDDEEFLLRAVMPEDQVDAMLAAGPSGAHYTPEAAPVLALLKELAARPAARDIVIERPGLRLALHAGASAGAA